MVLDRFHSSVGNWFQNAFEQPTEIQVKAWPEIRKKRNTLISAPTGSGKTLAAFLATIDDLIKQGLERGLSDQTQVVYVSPLKALSNDIQKNLQIPLKGIREELKQSGMSEVNVRVLVRTGDTSSSARTAMIKNPPHILVTTPESLYLLLTSENGRKMLSNVHTVIVDEIHALVGNKRGSHLSLSLERLNALTEKPPVRIGLSATQKPIETIARFLIGSNGSKTANKLNCQIINIGHRRRLEIAIEVPRSPLTAVMSNEVWSEIYERLEELINEHKTTLIFVNTRRLTERVTHNLTERLGPEIITAHHGSISKELRLDAEQRLKSGSLKALVATSSLELGIDIGSVDLVCQIGSPRSIAIFLQRVGRSGHTVKGTPKGKLFPLSLDELVECTALFDSVRRGELDSVIMPEKPLDILAQQIVAEVASIECKEDDLYDLVCNAFPYRDLRRNEFDDVIDLLSKGFATQRGRRGAYIHHDIVNGRLRARRGARLTALVSGGAIPDNFDFDVILEPTNTFIGTVNEDFAIESVAGDIFLLGNNSWRILGVSGGKVRVEDAEGLPPTIPFWFGEAPARSLELSVSVSRLREELSTKLGDLNQFKNGVDASEELINGDWKKDAFEYLVGEIGISPEAADQLVIYLGTVKTALGVMPSQNTLVMERFFDEAGAMHLVIHSPFGNRLNRAWGLALRKRFCRKFNFELQAASTEDSIILSLGATHSFPLEEVYNYLNPNTVRHVLTQALLDSPMFGVRWRWNASRALAVLRRRAGKKVPPPIQRIQSEDLLSLVFPDQLACQENVQGEREIPDHPLVNQTIYDCLYEAMDIEELEQLLSDINAGEKKLVALDLMEPSPFSQQILNARPYSFLDDAPLEERRSNAVQNRRWLDPSEAADLGKLDIEAIEAVKKEAWPQVGNADELHDALVLSGFLTVEEGKRVGDGLNGWEVFLADLIKENRASILKNEEGKEFWVAVERIPQMKEVYANPEINPEPRIPKRLVEQIESKEHALIEIIRGRLETLGPVMVGDLSESMGISVQEIERALIALENEGFVFRGRFTPGLDDEEWCERRLLARIHRSTLQRLRREIEPVSPADFMRFLFSWHNLESDEKPYGPDALRQVLNQLEGFEAPSASWEGELLPTRIKEYDHNWLDMLCLSGNTVWGRFRHHSFETNGRKSPTPIRSTPITLVNRTNLEIWKSLSFAANLSLENFSNEAREVLNFLAENGASFFDEIATKSGLLRTQVEGAIAELVALGLLTSDSFTGLRALLVESKYRTSRRKRNRRHLAFGMEQAGRWSLLHTNYKLNNEKKFDKESLITFGKVLLRRYGVVFRRIVDRENIAPPWRDLVKIFRILEARGQIRGGRFVEGVWGEQFALPEAVGKLRAVRRRSKNGTLVSISASDPVNLTGVITPGLKVTSIFKNRILYRDGVPIAIKEGKELRFLSDLGKNQKWEIQNALVQRKISPKLRAYLGKGVL
ncbi:DEAD/DEAH box helicase [Desulfobacterota bacterium AH_259_B03_O07]|nr:DEAD/DEAH box helicase [Desulfobacterota bacterium AH_259_B03_O07]